jgi:hypothetical protein
MKKVLFLAALVLGTAVVAAEDEAALKEQMKVDCAPLFVDGGECADVVKGTRNCTRQNKEKGGENCVNFEAAHKEFFDAGKDDPIIRE